MVQWKPNHYHLFKLDLSEEKYQHDVHKAIATVYSDHKVLNRRPFSFRRIVDVEYVKVIIAQLRRLQVSS